MNIEIDIDDYLSEKEIKEECKTAFGDISYKANEQACDTYNKIKNSKLRNYRIFQMALALAPTFAREGLNLQQRLLIMVVMLVVVL